MKNAVELDRKRKNQLKPILANNNRINALLTEEGFSVERSTNMIMPRLKMKQIIVTAYRFGVCTLACNQLRKRYLTFIIRFMMLLPLESDFFPIAWSFSIDCVRSSFERRKLCNTVHFIQFGAVQWTAFTIFTFTAPATESILVIWFYVSRAPIHDERETRRSENKSKKF